ncbi:MAG: helix-turn-helix domain-containing protein [Candidatus Korarchaeum sp.]
MIEEGCLFILWLLANSPRTMGEIERESSLPKATLYRKLAALIDRNWVKKEGGLYSLTDRARVLLSSNCVDLMGVFMMESLFSKAIKLR